MMVYQSHTNFVRFDCRDRACPVFFEYITNPFQWSLREGHEFVEGCSTRVSFMNAYNAAILVHQQYKPQ